MQRSKGGEAHTLGLDSWCVRPGNYSLNMWDHSGLSGASLGWRGGGIFLTDANDCKVLHATAQGWSSGQNPVEKSYMATEVEVSDSAMSLRTVASSHPRG